MKSGSLLTAIASVLFLSGTAFSNPKLPAASPRATVSQVVGINQISIDYSSPAVKNRTIFGDLVPYGELWRLGANAATTLTLTEDAKIANRVVPKGSYALFAIPQKDSWTIAISQNPNQWDTNAYDPSLDLFRFDVSVVKSPKRERLAFIFSNTTDSETRLDIEWAEIRASIPISVETKEQTVKNIEGYVDASWSPLVGAANYYKQLGQKDRALELLDASLGIQKTWIGLWAKAQLVAEKNKMEGLKLAKEAYELGNKASYFYAKSAVEKALKDWK